MGTPMDRHRRITHALLTWAKASRKGLRGGGSDTFNDIVFHHRPEPAAPETQVRFIATLVDGAPMIRVELVPDDDAPLPQLKGSSMRVSHSLPASQDSPQDPTAPCEACGTIGTAGWISISESREAEPVRHRFCADCFGPEAAWYRARYEDTQSKLRDAWLRDPDQPKPASGGGWSMQTATWHAVLELVRTYERMMHPMVPPSRDDFALIANDIARRASELVGPMPLEVEDFIQRYRSPAGANPS